MPNYPPPNENPKCICMQMSPGLAMICQFGHLTECHYPRTCSEAQCSHWQAAQQAEETKTFQYPDDNGQVSP